MKNSFTAAAAQFTPVSGDPEANLRKMEKLCDMAAEAGASLIVLPELALTGYYLKADALRALAVPQDGSWSAPLRKKAKEHHLLIAVGYPELAAAGCPELAPAADAPAASAASAAPGSITPGRPAPSMYNSCLLIGSDGEIIGNARKRYLWGREKRLFLKGASFDVFETELGELSVLLCYDMEYPEPSRIAALKGADMILCPAAWSRKASHRWRVETAANALFNLVYVIGANFLDENCCGDARIVGPDGTVIAEGFTPEAGTAAENRTSAENQTAAQEDCIVTALISPEELERCRAEIPYWQDLDPEILAEAARAAEGVR